MARNTGKIGTITMKIESAQLKKIANSGRLEEFIAKATDFFRRDLTTKLVSESASSVSTALFMEEDDFGTGPRPPFWHQLAKMESMETRIKDLERMIVVKREFEMHV